MHGIVSFPFNAVIMGHSVYSLFLLSGKRTCTPFPSVVEENADRLLRAGVVKGLESAAETTCDVFIRG